MPKFLDLSLAAADNFHMYRVSSRQACSAVLPPDERFVAAVQLNSGIRTLPGLGDFNLYLPFRFRILVASDLRLHLFTAAWFSVCKPKRHLLTLPVGSVLETHRRPLQLDTEVVIDGHTYWVKAPHWDELDEVVYASKVAAGTRLA